jgi:hypothetical protein
MGSSVVPERGSAGRVSAAGRNDRFLGANGRRGLEGLRRVRCLSVVFEFKLYFWLACSESDDAPDRVVRRHADGYAISRNHLDAEAAHSAAELGQDFVASIALHAVEPPAVHGHHGALHINQIVLTQIASSPFL